MDNNEIVNGGIEEGEVDLDFDDDGNNTNPGVPTNPTEGGETGNENPSGGDDTSNEGDQKEPEAPSEGDDTPQEPQLNNKNTGHVVFAVDENGIVYFYAPVNPDKYSPETGYNLENIRKDIIVVFPEMADVEPTDTKRWAKAMQEYSVVHFQKKGMPKELLLDKMARQ